MLNNYFDHIYCLNLDKRTDKWSECEEEFKNLGIIVERFSAIDGSLIDPAEIPHPHVPNRIAWRLSVINIFLDAKEKGYKNFLLLEDDIEFYYKFNDSLDDVMSQLPNDWDCFWFSGNSVFASLIPISPNIYKTAGTVCTHCIAFKNTSYDLIINELDNLNHFAGDNAIASLHDKLNMYITKPYRCWQRESFSDIEQTRTFHSHLADPDIYQEQILYKENNARIK